MTVPAYPLEPTDEMVCAAWIGSIPGLSPEMVGPVLPPDVTGRRPGRPAPWLQTGFVVISVAGGNPDPLLPIHRTVMDVQCFASVPGSNRPPWEQAFAIASLITKATWSRTTISRPLIARASTASPTRRPRVQGAKMLTSFRRLYGDAADYSLVQGDLWLSWIAPGDVIA